jgi:sn-glycerol 3-phosphate transport system permease protein
LDQRQVLFRGHGLPYLLLAPQLAVTAVFFLWPAAQAVVQSVQREDAFGLATEFVGLANFRALLQDPGYLNSLKVTAVFCTAVTALSLGVALLLAVMADRTLRAAGTYRTLLIWPYAIAPAVAAALWVFLFNPTVGIVAHALRGVGIGWNHLLDPEQAMLLVVLAAAWKQVSYNFLFFLAGLQAIPRSLVEAAAIDAAGPWRRFWTLQLPLLSPTTFFLAVVNLAYAFFETFGVIDATTQGGPVQATNTLVYKVYRDGVLQLDLGGSAAQSVVLMAIVTLLTVLQFRFVERRVHY